MHYHISRKSNCSQYIQIRLLLSCKAGEDIHLQLAAWRPGRYELVNYAQKIRGFQVNFENNPVTWCKKSKDLWHFTAGENGDYQVDYAYYCNQMDAGGCWSDDSQLYLNFSNFIFDVKERESNPIQINIALPKNYQVATALQCTGGHTWKASGYQQLMDSPLLAAATIQQHTYQVAGVRFHLWFQGEVHFKVQQLITAFQSFTEKQIQAFGEFPASDYHFIFQLLPYRHYHGVEHAYSTVITYGPAKALREKSEMDELMGVSSHELYHFWNVCRIRPKEILHYDLSKETYLNTGLVLEGVTTYMGDLFLLQSGYFRLQDYLNILEKQLQKEADNLGWSNQSIIESSFDLWLDGYKAGIPEKKVNIYNRGALIFLCLDILLRKEGSSLSQVMKQMWLKFGKQGKGYVLADFFELLALHANRSEALSDFISHYVNGKNDLLKAIGGLLEDLGIGMDLRYQENDLLHRFGIRTDGTGKVIQVHPDASAYQSLMVGDHLQSLNAIPFHAFKYAGNTQLEIQLERYGRNLSVSLAAENPIYFPKFSLWEQKATPLGKQWCTA
jgi:predicted metalloprotease with PDZ domain